MKNTDCLQVSSDISNLSPKTVNHQGKNSSNNHIWAKSSYFYGACGVLCVLIGWQAISTNHQTLNSASAGEILRLLYNYTMKVCYLLIDQRHSHFSITIT